VPHLASSGIPFEPLVSNSPDSLPDNALLPEKIFRKMVSLERKRAERSGRRLVLLLLECPRLLQSGRNSALDSALLSLLRSARDTDVAGWYRENAILGVLFNEILASESSIVEILSRKVSRALVDALGPQQATEVTLSFHVFPDDFQGQDPGHRAFSIMYPDLAPELESKRASLVVKRCIDIGGGLALLVLLAPLMLLIACLVGATSRGPILFRQKRLGRFGEGFTFLKFRSMYAKTDQSIHENYIKWFIANQNRSKSEGKNHSQAFYKLTNDPRITKVGAFLRRTSLDELPQLWNVVTGKMSLVGPRPPLPYEFESYKIWHRRRLLVKPGITGFWQVDGRSRVKFDDMVRMDLQYAAAWSLWLDIKILWRTPRAVLSGNGAC
jgi:lipopolysaccharide/colanic/teichoic acid biosynthesis glycosyltransferase